MATNLHEEVNRLTAEVMAIESANRTPEQMAILAGAAQQYTTEISPNKIKIVEGHPGTNGPISIYQDPDSKQIVAKPIDPIVISFYEYKPTPEQEAERREKNPGIRKDVSMSGALQLVDNVTNPETEISMEQLIAVQNLMGNNSTWWPIKDYTEQEVKDVFNALELSVVYKEGVPIGIAHLDKSGMLGEDGELKTDPLERSTKVVFVALDPAMHKKGIGKEVLNEMMTRALDGGAAYVTLDTVLHRDVRSEPGSMTTTTDSAGKVYEKAGFQLSGATLINPGDAAQLEAEGLAINQLNGPLEYVSKDWKALRTEVCQTFGLPIEETLAKIEEWSNTPTINLTDKTSTALPKALGIQEQQEQQQQEGRV